MALTQRQIAYYYNGIIKTEETDLDFDGDIKIPVEGEVLLRPGGKQWRVVKVTSRHDGGNALPVYMVYLTPVEPN
jgi:hypothetical protein